MSICELTNCWFSCFWYFRSFDHTQASDSTWYKVKTLTLISFYRWPNGDELFHLGIFLIISALKETKASSRSLIPSHVRFSFLTFTLTKLSIAALNHQRRLNHIKASRLRLNGCAEMKWLFYLCHKHTEPRHCSPGAIHLLVCFFVAFKS